MLREHEHDRAAATGPTASATAATDYYCYQRLLSLQLLQLLPPLLPILLLLRLVLRILKTPASYVIKRLLRSLMHQNTKADAAQMQR